jgi:rhodanese-related sulfurtransferase
MADRDTARGTDRFRLFHVARTACESPRTAGDRLASRLHSPAGMTPTLFDRATPLAHGYRDLAATDLAARSGRARLVDVREPHEWRGDLGRVPGSELVPLATVLRAARTWDRDEELVLICRSGQRSACAAEALAARGFRRVMNLAGGMLAYAAAGLPVERSGGRVS